MTVMAESWLTFVEAGTSTSGKTRLWAVTAKADGGRLGTVLWWAPWRKYAFVPTGDPVFEEDCLRDVAAFCERQTRDHRAARQHPAGAAP
jgi:hypothetical protein